jgi:hypothetical protein
MKRTIVILAVVAMVVGLLALPALADSDPWSATCSVGYSAKSKAYAYTYQIHTNGSSSWSSGSYSGADWRSHLWLGDRTGSGYIISDKNLIIQGLCVPAS